MLFRSLGYTFNWYINDVLQCSEANPKLWDLDNNLECDGVVELTLEIITVKVNSLHVYFKKYLVFYEKIKLSTFLSLSYCNNV